MQKLIESIKRIWQLVKPIVCVLETEEEKKVVLEILKLYRDNQLYIKGNKRYKSIDANFSKDEDTLLDNVITKLEK